MQRVKLPIKASKCQVGQSSVVYFGHDKAKGKVPPLKEKVQGMLEWELPTIQT